MAARRRDDEIHAVPFRHGIGLLSAAAPAVVALTLLDATMQLLAFGFAVLDFRFLPFFLKHAG